MGEKRNGTVVFKGGGYVIRFKPEHAQDGFKVLFDSNYQYSAFKEDDGKVYSIGPELKFLLDQAHVPYEIIRQS